MSHPIPDSQLLEALNWRYATKAFDPSKKIPTETWKALEQTLILSPSSFGIQPYQFLVVENPALREQLLPHSWGQRQIVDASHLVVFAARTTLSDVEIDRYLDRIVEVRGVTREALEGLRRMMGASLTGPGNEARIPHWAALQSYIALGNFMTSAALLGIDTCPIEGFVPSEYDKLLGLKKGGEQGFTSVVVAVVGYRSSEDKYASFAKVRLPAEELIKTV
jgi:nitroreductase